MIVIDTNVVSEVMRARPEARVMRWFDAQPSDELHVTSITQAEILAGIAMLPRGKRRESLTAEASGMFDEDFADRIMHFDSAAAAAYAVIRADRRRMARPIGVFDAQIAAIARAHAARVATRNIDDFSDCGVELIDPWQA